MPVRLAPAAILFPALLAACAGATKSPEVSIAPGGSVTVAGAVLLTATVSNSTAVVAWSLVGPGSLSGTSGRQVTYRAPQPIGGALTATVTATAESATATVTLNLVPPPLAAAKVPGLTGKVSVTYDQYDIPHIACAAAKDCYAVWGYLHARDRLFPMDFYRRVGRGRLAELLGVFGLEQDVQLRTLFTTRDGKRVEDGLVAALDPASPERARMDAYVAGINARLAELRANPALKLPGEYAQLLFPVTAADIPDWTPADLMAMMRLFQFQLSESLFEELDFTRFAGAYGADAGKMKAYVRSAAPPQGRKHTCPAGSCAERGPADEPKAAPRAAQAPAPAVPDVAAWGPLLDAAAARLARVRETIRPLGEGAGSNNWVVDAAHSASGKAMVANDPHLSLAYPPAFHLATLTSSNAADALDAAGAAFPGLPAFTMGRSAHVAWGVTVVGYDVSDLYLEQVVPAGTPLPNGACPAAALAGCAVFNGAGVPLLPVPEKFKVRVGAGSAGLVDAATVPGLSVPPMLLVVPHHGPIIQLDTTTGKGLSARWTGQENNTQDIKAFMGLNVAADVDAAMAAVDFFTTGAQNFVFGDDKGNIGFNPHAWVPVRSFADPAIAGADTRPPWFALPGGGGYEWGTGVASDNCAGTGANQPKRACWLADDKLPRGKNPAKGFFATANSDPLGVTDDNNPLAHQPYLSFAWDDSTGFRESRIVSRLEALTAGGGKVSLADMQALQADHVSTVGAAFVDVITALPASSNATFEAGRALLAQWKADGYDCPTGLLGIDPKGPIDPDATRSRDSSACFLFHAFLRTLLQSVFADDLALAGVGLSARDGVKSMLYMLTPGTPASEQSLCNDVNSRGVPVATHTCYEQVGIALVTAYATLNASLGAEASWRWGRVHTSRPLSLGAPLVAEGYQPGPYARPGGAFTVDVGNPSVSQKGLTTFNYGSSAQVRHISVMDPAAPILKMQLPGPERDGPSDVFAGPSLLEEWMQNQYFDFAYGSQIAGAAVASQEFTAP